MEITIRSIDQLVNHKMHIRVRIVFFPCRVRTCCIIAKHLSCGKTENNTIILTNCIADLDICTIQRAQRNRTVHHELHIACAGCLFARRRNLLAYISSRIYDFANRHAEVFNEYDLHHILDALIVIDLLRDRIDETHRLLCNIIAWRSLAAKEIRCWQRAVSRIILQAMILIHDMQDIHDLSLVRMDALDLDIELGIRIDLDSIVLHRILGKCCLAQMLDFPKAFQERLIAGKFLQCMQCLWLFAPFR